MIYSEYLQFWQDTLYIQKQKEILKRIKKPIGVIHNPTHTDKAKIIDLKLDKDGSVLTTLQGEKYKVRSYPDMPTVMLTAYYKKFIPLIMSNLARMGWFKRIITVLAIKYNFNILPEWFEWAFTMDSYLLKDEHYSRPVKEIRRLLKGMIDDKLIDAIGLIIEYDSAYRYPLQDIIALLDKKAFRDNPKKEIKRLFGILCKRSMVNEGKETIYSTADKFNNIYKLLKIYLIFNRKLLKVIKEKVEDMRTDQIKPTEEDTYWMLFLKTHNCFGLSEVERTKKFNELKNGS